MGADNWDVDRIGETAADFQGSTQSTGFDYKKADAGFREYVKQRPGLCLSIAGAVGLFLGAVLRRR